MTKLFDAQRKYQNGQLSRREFLKVMATLGVATPAVSSFLAACAPQATETAAPGVLPTAAAATAEAPSTAELLAALTKADTEAAPLVADGWSYQPETVLQMQDIFMEQNNETVSFEVIPGDYSATMLNKMIAKAPVDAMYSKLEAAKFADAGWIVPIEDLWDVQKAKQDMLPVILEALTYKGKLYSLPYNCGVKSMAGYNSAILQEAGIGKEELPKTWDELYDMCSRLKKDGVADTPIVMMWTPNQDGIVHNWQAESMNRGDPMWNEEFEAVFDENSGAALTLAAWNRLWTEKLVPTDNLVLGFVDARGVFATGTIPFITLQQWHFKTLNDPQQGNVAGKFMPIPYAGQPWGLLDYAGYAVVKQEDELRMARAARWVDFMGYRDKTGEILVGKQWVTCCGVDTAYPEARSYPDVEAAYKTWMPEYPYVRDVFAECLAHVNVVTGWKALWYPEWGTYVATALPDAITGKRSVPEVIKDLKDKWNQFRSMYVA